MNGSDEVESCRVCGCTEERACIGGCSWFVRRLCTSCIQHATREELNIAYAAGRAGAAEEELPPTFRGPAIEQALEDLEEDAADSVLEELLEQGYSVGEIARATGRSRTEIVQLRDGVSAPEAAARDALERRAGRERWSYPTGAGR